MLLAQKLLNLARLPVLTAWVLVGFLIGLVMSSAILFPVIFLQNYFFFDRIRNYFLFCYFYTRLFAINVIPISIIFIYRGLLCYFYIYYSTFCLEPAHLYNSAAWLQFTKLSLVEAINIIGRSILCIFLSKSIYLMSNWWSLMILLLIYSITCSTINYGIFVLDRPNYLTTFHKEQ